MITSQFRPSPLGPSRKYYSLTQEGEELLKEFEVCWRNISDTVEGILKLKAGVEYERNKWKKLKKHNDLEQDKLQDENQSYIGKVVKILCVKKHESFRN